LLGANDVEMLNFYADPLPRDGLPSSKLTCGARGRWLAAGESKLAVVHVAAT
jgi:hypothetical protein